MPVGTIVSYAGNDIPDGWIACDSKSYLPTTYPELYAAIGYTYGMGGTKYRVPDTRGVFMRGMDANATRDTNRPAGSVQLDMLAYDGGNVNEIGMVAFYAVNKPPANWLVCDGVTYAINLYTPLYNVIGNLYGGVSGSTFAVPDLRGRFIRGLDGGANVDSGRTIGSTQDDSLQQHGHNMYEGDGGGAGRSPATRSDDDGGLRYINGGLSGEVYVREIARGSMDGNIARVSGETRPKNVALLPCIRFR